MSNDSQDRSSSVSHIFLNNDSQDRSSSVLSHHSLGSSSSVSHIYLSNDSLGIYLIRSECFIFMNKRKFGHHIRKIYRNCYHNLIFLPIFLFNMCNYGLNVKILT
ncbi:hypothetical protein KUTeg_023751 [Tegillarca granosa]|uniref:Uncharacterized protein n=1 Tax=Tegillarca granosa TaxID=220873 RepID=A0ABQ9E2L0_TEGGR|nr:hypothetical protein KUTeg_023751 [Tegillarca granosa]